MMATFQMTGAAYDRKNFRWLFSTPRHQADRTSRPAPGKRIRTSRIASSRFSPSKPGAMALISSGVATTPTRTSSDMASARTDPIAPATRPASSRSSRARSDA
jgi:hypothetical protein